MLNALKGWDGNCQVWQTLYESDPESCDERYGNCPMWNESPLVYAEDELHWVMSVNVGALTQERPVEEVGVEFRRELEDDIAKSFLEALHIVSEAPVFAPMSLVAPLAAKGPEFDRLALRNGLWQLPSEDCDRLARSDLAEEHIDRLKVIWKRLAKAYSIFSWKKYVGSEELFSKLDKDVGNLVQEGDVDTLCHVLEERWGVPVTLTDARDVLMALAQTQPEAPGGAGGVGQHDQERYRRIFARRFRELRNEYMAANARIGRAARIFTSSLDLPPLQLFVSMCIVLEVLFNTGFWEQKGARLSSRVCWLLAGGDPAEAAGLKEFANEVYRDRSKVVHGKLPLEKVHWLSQAEAGELARRSIIKILCDGELFRIFSDDKLIDTFFDDVS